MGLFNREKAVSEKVSGNNNVPENGQIIVVKRADEYLVVRRGGGMLRKEGGVDTMVRGGANPEAYKDYIEY